MKSLADAERALAADDEEAALAALLDAWRATRAPQIAALVDAIGARLDAAMPKAFGGKRADLHAVWTAIAAERRAADWPRLVREIVLTANRFGVAVVEALVERAQAIADWPADPRTLGLVHEHLRRPGYESSSSSTYPYWSTLCDLVVAHGDPRAADVLATLKYAQLLRVYSDRKKATVWFQAKVDETVARLRQVAPAKPLDKAQLAACAKLAKAIAKRGPVSGAQVARLVREPAKPKAKPAPRKREVVTDESATARHLGAAAGAAESGDDVRALDELLAAWRTSRSARIAALIDSASRRVVGAGFEGGSRAEMQAAWLALAKHRRAADLPVLVANITNTYGRSTEALARVEALAKWPADPRTGPIVAKILARPAFHASSTKPFWTALIALAVAHGDARTLAALVALAGTFARALRQTWTDTSAIARWFENQVAAACTELRARPAALEPDPALCARFEAALGASPADRVLAEHAANPDDEGLRQVLADALLERGDPRGEFIALQVSGKNAARAAKLLAKHGRAWLGGLADHVDPARTRFERGFPVELALTANARDADALAGDPAWATVRRLHLDDLGRLPEALLRHPVMRLEHLGSLGKKLFHELLAWREIPYRSLGTTFAFTKRDLDALLGARTPLARLRALEVYDQQTVGSLWSAWLADQLEAVRIYNVTTWADLFGRLRQIRRPTIHAGPYRVDAGDPGELVAEIRVHVIGTLARLGPGTLTGLRTVRPTTKTGLRAVQDHAKRIGCTLEFVD